MNQLKTILEGMFPGVDFDTEKKLIDSGIIESAAMVELISELEDSFDVEIDMEYIQPKYFQSIEAMADMLTELGAEI